MKKTITSIKNNKYNYLYIIQGHYGGKCGWEDLTASDDKTEAMQDLKDYRENEKNILHRIIQRRILKKILISK